jgi:hypothetical protein
MLGYYSFLQPLLQQKLDPSPSSAPLCRRWKHTTILRMVIVCIIVIIGLKPVVSNSAHDTVRPAREIHSETLVWPGADYGMPNGVGPRSQRGEAGGRALRFPPSSHAYTGPNGDDTGGARKSRPPAPPGLSRRPPARRRRRSDPTGAARAPREAKVT